MKILTLLNLRTKNPPHARSLFAPPPLVDGWYAYFENRGLHGNYDYYILQDVLIYSYKIR